MPGERFRLPARRLRGVAILFAAILSSSAPAAPLDPAITLTTTETTVYAGDSIVVEIEAIGLDAPLDLAPLARAAELLRETGGTRIGVVGGRVVEVRTRRLEFIAPGEGLIRFGPLVGEVGGLPVRSNALAVSVLPPADVDWAPAARDLTTTFSLSSATPVIGERVVADLVLRYRDGHAVTDERIRLPTFDGFDTLAVHESRRRTVETDAGPMREIAWRWLLFPTRSGPMAAGDLHWSGEIVRSRTQRARFERTLPAVDIVVAQAPMQAPADRPGDDGAGEGDDGGWWLPATAVTLEEAWSRDPREISAGDELVRTLTLTARDVLARQLPVVVPLESRSITSTPIGERREQLRDGDHVISSATFEFRLRATSPVPVFLDTVRVRWWDTAAREPREAIVPARRIDIGLPERPDLLAELALGERGLRERLGLRLASLGERHAPWWLSLAILAALLLWLLFGQRLDRRRAATSDPLPPL